MPHQILITLTDDDMAIMKAVDAFMQAHGRSPKKREIVTGTCLDRDYKGSRAARGFERLKLLGIIEHSQNGHCWLTPQGKQALSAD